MIYKTIYIGSELHQKLKLRAIQEGTTITLLVHKFLEKKISLPLEEQLPSNSSPIQKELVELPIEPQEESSESIKPCGWRSCKTTAKGKYRILTDQGAIDKTMFLCPLHLAMARREGEVAEIKQ